MIPETNYIKENYQQAFMDIWRYLDVIYSIHGMADYTAEEQRIINKKINKFLHSVIQIK